MLTDGKLPDGSGIEIADDAKRRGIMAVLITGLALTYSKDELEYLIKPVRPYELLTLHRGVSTLTWFPAGKPRR